MEHQKTSWMALLVPTANPGARQADGSSFTAASKSTLGTYSKSHVTATPLGPASGGPCPSHLSCSQIPARCCSPRCAPELGNAGLAATGPGEASLHGGERAAFPCCLAPAALGHRDYTSTQKGVEHNRKVSSKGEETPPWDSLAQLS